MRRWTLFGLGVLLMLAALPVFADSGTFSNPAPITIPVSGPGNPFPSFVTVSGLSGVVTDVNVTISGFSHTRPDDVQIVLAGPGGRVVMLMVWAGGATDAVNLNLTFDDQAAATVPAPMINGTFRPTQLSAPIDLIIDGGPALPYGTVLSDFNGAAPNGTWRLYVYNDYASDSGSIARGWSIEITTTGPGQSVVMTCYPPLTANAVVGSLPYNTQVYYEPGNIAPGLMLNAGTYHVLGVDESGQYYAIVLGCDRLWVPVASMVPNTNPDDSLWFGHPLPTGVIAS